ncbi:methyltransferase family protein [Nitrospina gracilis]|uniref:methyltransferase family protein n=1 Tax=Nitrospina gracilis TaxID=35801 RepID=UPI001F4896F4|nr:isoprenylcysteine carboxylmethyltransferase family protein [Nitrospina gracilis]MCF8720426.1 protein-S-isoprenylcysteine O-methyltransferase Ste14 [Nitrospina gracilis Nb-211]
MLDAGLTFLSIADYWIWANFLVYLCVFAVALYINYNFNTIMVGVIYLLPLIPFGLEASNAPRFLMVSFQNLVFGVIEVVIFVITVKPRDATFDRDHIKQLIGHVLPIAAALIGLSFVARMSTVPMSTLELGLITTVFLAGSVLRVLAVYQLGATAFKFDIVFRDDQQLKTTHLYRFIRHPSYTAMMVVILAYALNTHHLLAGILGMLSAAFGFQYRIHYEEEGLKERFGEDYLRYRSRTGMWLPRPGRVRDSS